MRSEAEEKADFTRIRYAQCWEDADILVPALAIKNGETVVSIASAGDNTFSLLSQGPAKVYALDLSAAQLACLDYRKAAYACLNYEEFLQAIGVRATHHRLALYHRLREEMAPSNRDYWDQHLDWVQSGIVGVGKFENYFNIFSTKLLPLVHSTKRIDQMLKGGTKAERVKFYEETWNNQRWKLMFKFFFSRQVMGRLGRDPSFFEYVEGSVADRILERTAYAIKELNPAENPYMHWILRGCFGEVLPHALREENFEAIKNNLPALEVRQQSLEAFIAEMPEASVDAYNLSDIFEYMSNSQMEQLYEGLLRAGKSGARIAYWNMLAPRACPEKFQSEVACCIDKAESLFKQDKAFFYSAFRIEEVK